MSWNDAKPVQSRHRFVRHVVYGICLLAWLCTGQGLVCDSWGQQSSGTLLITSAKAVHDLSPDLVARAHVHLTGTVTYYDAPELILFLQDDTGGVFVNVDHIYPFHPGQLISVDGNAKSGYRTEIASNARMSLLGPGPFVKPSPADYASLASGGLDCMLVSLEGTVRDAVIEHHPEAHSQTLHMDLSLPGGEVEVYVNKFAQLDPLSLVGSKLKLTGVAGGAFDAKEQLNGVILYVSDDKGIQVISRSQDTLSRLPVTSIDDAFSTMRSTDSSPRLHIRGTVTYYASGESAVLEQDGNGLYLQTRETKPIAVGDVVDAYGFADDHGYSPTLRDTVLVRTGDRKYSVPTSLGYDAAISGIYSDRLISIEGKLISQLHTPGSEALTINVDGHPVRGSIRTSLDIPDLPLDTRVRLTGICRIVTGGPWRQPVLFNVDMRSPQDIVVTKKASWGTVRHLAYLLGTLLVFAITIAVWALFLRRRIASQSLRIERSMAIARCRGEILEQISSNASMTVLLETLAQSVHLLLPTVSCTFTVDGVADEDQQEKGSKLADIPFLLGEEALGNFSICGDSRFNLIEQEDVLAMVREVIAIACRHASLHDRLIHHSTHDPLTDLPNRRLCETQLDEALVKAAELRQSLSIIYVDINKFKEVNDRYGHYIGDLYLKTISARLSAELAVGDMLARVGGDEFVVLLPGTRLQEAEDLLWRLHRCFRSPFDLEGVIIQGSASFGTACFPDHGTTREELERHADSAMYLAKRGAENLR